MRFILFYSKIFNLNDENILSKIGGVQRYMFELGKVLKKNFEAEVILVQLGGEEKYIEFENLKIYQFKDQPINALIKYFKKNNFVTKADVFIWGSDTLSVKTEFKSIAIQHGVACDYFSTESLLQKQSYKIPIIALGYKILQLIKSYKVFENSEYKVCVDYNYLNWYRTFNIYRNNMNKIHVIPNFSQIPTLNIHENKEKIVISFARRFHHKRGAKLLCEVADDLLKTYNFIEFWFAGEGEEFSYVDDLMKKYPLNVKITKFSQNETFTYHKKVDIAVVPTIASEGTSLSLLEAMASGCAVVCTNIGGMTNIVLDEFNGLIVNPDYISLKTALVRVIENYDYRVYLGSNARLTVEKSFSLDIWERKWVDFIQKVLANHD